MFDYLNLLFIIFCFLNFRQKIVWQSSDGVKRQRIEIVAKEVLGLNDDEDKESRSPYPAPDDDKEQDLLVKGKGTGKGRSRLKLKRKLKNSGSANPSHEQHDRLDMAVRGEVAVIDVDDDLIPASPIIAKSSSKTFSK